MATVADLKKAAARSALLKGKLDVAAEELRAQNEKRDALALQLHESGTTPKELSEVLGVTRGRVHQVLQEQRARKLT